MADLPDCQLKHGRMTKLDVSSTKAVYLSTQSQSHSMGVEIPHAVPFHLGSASQYSNQVPSIFSEMDIVGEY